MFISTKEKIDIFHAVGVLMDKVAALEKHHHHVTSARSNNTLESTMPLKPHPTDPDKLVYVKSKYCNPEETWDEPRTWVGLTDEEKQVCIKETDKLAGTYKRTSYLDLLVNTIEDALRRKNT